MHITIKFHQFCEHVSSDNIKIFPSTTEQIADVFTKPLSDSQFDYTKIIDYGEVIYQ